MDTAFPFHGDGDPSAEPGTALMCHPTSLSPSPLTSQGTEEGARRPKSPPFSQFLISPTDLFPSFCPVCFGWRSSVPGSARRWDRLSKQHSTDCILPKDKAPWTHELQPLTRSESIARQTVPGCRGRTTEERSGVKRVGEREGSREREEGKEKQEKHFMGLAVQSSPQLLTAGT